MAEIKKQQKMWAKIVARAWEDEAYKNRLLANPAAVLKEEGAEVLPDLTYRVQEAGEKEIVLVLPAKPSAEHAAEMGEERLAAIIPSETI